MGNADLSQYRQLSKRSRMTFSRSRETTLSALRLDFFQTVGTKALLAYELYSIVVYAVQAFCPKDSPAWNAYASLILIFAIT